MHYHFIVNPNSAKGKGLATWNTVKKHLDKNGVDFDVYFTASSQDAYKRTRELIEDPFFDNDDSCIICVGGDGTMNEVVNGIKPESTPLLGIIPSGRGNDLARGIGIKKKTHRNIENLIKDPHIDLIDYGVLSAPGGIVRRFTVSSGIGFDAQVCRAQAESGLNDVMAKLHILGVSYLINGIKTYLFTKPSKGFIILDGERRIEFENLLFISVQNLPYEGGGYKFCPDACPFDGHFEVCVITMKNKARTFKQVFSNRKNGRIKKCGVARHFRCSEIRIHTDRPLAVHTDGETLPAQSDVEMRCVKGKLRILK